MNTEPHKRPSRKPFQFGVGTILVLTTVLAAGLEPFPPPWTQPRGCAYVEPADLQSALERI